MKPIVLIGHRGVGKTSLLSRYAELGSHVLDLDAEIESSTGLTVSKIFQEQGEAAFRKIERETFEAINPRQDLVVAVGAGFPVDTIPPRWHVIWVRRPTDESGRIFSDRPRLDAGITALEEFHSRARLREPLFAERADVVMILDEGIELTSDPAERAFIREEIDLAGATLTITKWPKDFTTWINLRLRWNLTYFELRDDLLTTAEIDTALKLIPKKKVLLSFRDAGKTAFTLELANQHKVATDWDIELGEPPLPPTYLSTHTGSVSDAVKLELELKNLDSNSNSNFKLALKTNSFAELMAGHAWQAQDPTKRVFLPMSEDGRWSWYRLLRRDYSLNFVRESEGSASDQPTLMQWMRRTKSKTFAAVLGDPVNHSRTPMEQRNYFEQKGEAVYAIRVQENEWAEAVPALQELGLTAAAVTAPLKHKAAELVGSSTPINTLKFKNGIAKGTNTDLFGLQKAAAALRPARAQVVWGGGGTLHVIKQVFPQAQLVSVRTGKLRETNEPAQAPDILIWAANLKHENNLPPDTWKPRFVFDLNYSEASPAREYAQRCGAEYVSGLAMFRAQAQSQRLFWESK